MRRYKFEGYTITNCGYHQPDHCVWWEACDDDGMACFHGKTLREVEFLILESKWEDKLNAKDREVDELRRRLKVAEDAISSASDAFRFCIEQCELELSPKMIGKLCDDGQACERALSFIREEGGLK